MQHREKLNPSPSLRKNIDIYNTFDHASKNRESVLNLLAAIFEKHANDPTPISPLDRIKKIGQLPDYMLVYLMVEIDKMTKEGSCFPFEKREPGCLTAFFNAYSIALSDIDSPTFDLRHHTLDTDLHRVNSDVTKVTMEYIDENSSGKYRPNHGETLTILASEVSVDGIEHLIDLIDGEHQRNSGRLSSMSIGCAKDYEQMHDLINEADSTEKAEFILKKLSQIDDTDQDSVLLSINSLFHEKYPNYLLRELTEEDLMTLYFNEVQLKERLIERFQDLLTNDKSNDNKLLADVITDLNTAQTTQSIIKAIKQASSTPSGVKEIGVLMQELRMGWLQMFDEAANCQCYLIFKDLLWASMQKYNVNTKRELAQAIFNRLHQTNDELYFTFPKLDHVYRLMAELKEECSDEHVKKMMDKSLDEKLTFIYEHIQLMLLVHPFIDANNRTYANEIAPRFHLQLGIDVPIHFNPFVLYAHSLPEIVETIKLNIANFFVLVEIANGNHFGFDLKEQSLTKEQREQIAEFVAPFRAFIEKLLVEENVNYIEKQFKSYLRDIKNRAIKLFNSPSQEKDSLSKDLAEIRKLTNTKEMHEYLTRKSKEYAKSGNQANRGIAGLYTDVLGYLPNQIFTAIRN